MPEEQNSEFAHHEVEQAELQKEFDEVLVMVNRNIDRLLVEAETEEKDPVDIMLEHGFERDRQIRSTEDVDGLEQNIRALRGMLREELRVQLQNIIEAYIRPQYFDAEIRAKRLAVEAEEEVRRQEMLEAPGREYIQFGAIKAVATEVTGNELMLKDGTQLVPGDSVLEIHWAGEDMKQPGLHDVQAALHRIAAYLTEHPNVKAVGGISWLLSRRVSEKLGFTVYPEVPVSEKLSSSITNTAATARQDKPYKKGISPTDVVFGAMSRNEFLQRYGG